MHQEKIKIKRALISVSDKTNIVEFAKYLHACNIEIISTGGTSELLHAENIPVVNVHDVTNFPEIMDGRVKTLHPKIHGGILGLRDQHKIIAENNDIDWIDLVIVNLYPFAETIRLFPENIEKTLENIDIGGPTLIRAAAKNMGWVGVIVEPSDYQKIMDELQDDASLSFDTREYLAKKAFQHTAQYDCFIANYLNQKTSLPNQLHLSFQKKMDCRYGENPHQIAAAYVDNSHTGILSAAQYQGKQLSYNNIVDADAALAILNEFSETACVIVKHANPCGVAQCQDMTQAFQSAYAADPLSAFGGVLAINQACDVKLAHAIAAYFFEIVLAPSFSDEALQIFSAKPNLRVLTLPRNKKTKNNLEFRSIFGGALFQTADNHFIESRDLKIVSAKQPTSTQLQDLCFAWKVVKHIKSNAILIAKENTTCGIGAGQVSRIDAVKIALEKAGDHHQNAVLASDAFFPFRDSIDYIATKKIVAVIQPEGGQKLNEIIQACDEYGIALVLSPVRCFKH